MKCKYCGTAVSPKEIYCKNCGREIRIVPDYNPIDDVLAAEIKDSLNNNNKPKNADAGKRREARRIQAEKREAKRRKRNIILVVVIIAIIAIISVASVLIYRSSYTGLINRGNQSVSENNYDQAISLFNEAISKKPEEIKGYDALAQLYNSQGDAAKAETVYTDAIKKSTSNTDLYESLIHFYIAEETPEKVTSLLNDAPDTVRDKLSDYIVAVPAYSLDDSQVYDNVQQLSLSSKGGTTIYYTIDGSNPLDSGIAYSEPIQLSDEGTTEIKSITKDKQGIPSMVTSKTYTITFPVIDAPSISPSTGQYNGEEQIEIKVPDGYTAYYTMDGSNPSAASTLYENPVEMPQGNTIFKAVLIDSSNRSSAVSTRNYIFETE
ncbi:MAG: chitobiase/beta-hexosaminidase C-terminal domain-containing protein [Suipraeoptans sp.]